ncbi:hypothetical protein [Gordonia neofelifaecis]|uniref:Low molecular weight antigen MTB12-like C-terminal domain-containing protein n=1 Tax=Gordonia neofelifaecis NRRL B-59395 TaxID=644548 RepID=F1YNS1_9ACTN|nr:hypothetical protein [Gordonia neofelifaecis]EGD53678.1 hypothetical protein SCNU_17837 [Gordonia neofelifaecis NRRL B-59395]
MSRGDNGKQGGGVGWPTVIASAGLAGVTSAVIVVVGIVGMMLSRDPGAATVAEPPATVVNLGDAQQAMTPANQVPATSATPSVAQAPVPAVSAPTPGAPTDPQQQPAVVPRPGGPAPSAPTAASLGEFNRQLATLSGDSSSAEKAKLLEGGARAVGPISKVLYLVKQYSYTGFRYEVVGPLTQNGTTASARLRMTLPGSGSRYIPLRWVWQDGGWKLTNKSVCDIAAYAQMPCSL